MLYDIIILEPFTSFCIIHDHVTVTCNITLTSNSKSKNKKIKSTIFNSSTIYFISITSQASLLDFLVIPWIHNFLSENHPNPV